MRGKRLVGVAGVFCAVALAVGSLATTPPAGQVLSFLLLSTQQENPGDLTHSATKVSVLNLGTASCSYTVRFLDKAGVSQCERIETVGAGKQTSFSTGDVPDDIYQSANNCPSLDDHKGSVEVFVSNVSTCRQRTVVDGFRAHWKDVQNDCAGTCQFTASSCASCEECAPNFCTDEKCDQTQTPCTTDADCAANTCNFACGATGAACTIDDGAECATVGTPVTADRMTILSIDKYSLKLQSGD